MPKTLTEAQKIIVKELLDLLIDLPVEEKSLSLEIEKLKQALAKKEDLETQDDIFRLQQCFQKPTTQFLRLESQNPELCVGSVQEFILDCIDQKVKEAAQEAKLDTQTLNWNKDAFLEILHRHENTAATSAVFHSQQPANDYNPLLIPVEEAKMYLAKFIKDADFRLLNVQITVDLPGLPVYDGEPILYPEYVNSRWYEDSFIRAQLPVARAMAEIIVAEVLLKELLKKHVLTAGEKYRTSVAVRQLVLYRFYFNALANKEIDYKDISGIEMEDLIRLTNPAIMALIKARKCVVSLAPYFTDPELAVIQHHYYLEEILNGNLLLASIADCVTPEQSYVLTLTGVVYLQKKGKINFEAAKTIPAHTAPIFLSEACLRLIMEDKLLLDDIKQLNKDQARLLADFHYAGEFYHERLGLPEIKAYNPDELNNLLFTPLIELQNKKIITRDRAKGASPLLRDILDDELYFGLIVSKALEYTLFEDINPHQVSVLLDPKIKQLVRSGILDVKVALALKKKEKEILIKPAAQKLYAAGKIKIKHLEQMFFGFASMLDKNRILFNLIDQDVLSIDECLRGFTNNELLTHPVSMWGVNFGGRLFGIFKNKPYQNKGHVDDFDTIKNDLEKVIEANPNYSRKSIIKQAIIIFSRFLRQKLAREFEAHLEEGSVYIQFLKELLEIELNPPEEKEIPGDSPSLSRLNQMAGLAKQKIALLEAKNETPSAPFTKHSLYLLPPPTNNQDLAQIKAFYHGMCALLEFNDVLEANTRNRAASAP